MPRKDWLLGLGAVQSRHGGSGGAVPPRQALWACAPPPSRPLCPDPRPLPCVGECRSQSPPWATLSTEVCVPRLLPNASQRISFCKTLSRFSKCFWQDGWFATSVSTQPGAGHGVVKSCEPPGSLLWCCSSHLIGLLLSPEISTHPRAQPQEVQLRPGPCPEGRSSPYFTILSFSRGRQTRIYLSGPL